MSSRKRVTPLSITRSDSVYFNIVTMHKVIAKYYKGVFNARLLFILCCIATYGSKGCNTFDVLGAMYTEYSSVNLRTLNRSVLLLVENGLVIRSYRRLYISVHAEKILSGRL